MKKYGFTLSELMIVITIISVIILFYIPINKVIRAQYTTLAYSVYETLSVASKELMSGDVSVVFDNDRKHSLSHEDGKLILNPNTQSFCACLSDILNVSGDVYCPSSENDYSSVSGSDPLSYKFVSKNWDEPNIVGTNGYKYYISSHHNQENTVSESYGYRVIAVDLTGKKKPNSEDTFPDSPSGQPNDIIYFIMLDNGGVYPIGIAASDRNYINTRTVAYYFTSKNLPENLKDSKAIGCKNFTSSEGLNLIKKKITDESGQEQWVFDVGSDGKPRSDFKDLTYNADKYKINEDDPLSTKTEKQHMHELGCNFWKDNLKITNDGEQQLTYSFRTAYCIKNGQNAIFKGYSCQGTGGSDSQYYFPVAQATQCQGPDLGADECVVEPVKPLYKVKI